MDDTVTGVDPEDTHPRLNRVLGELDALLRDSGALDAATYPNYETLVKRLGSLVLKGSEQTRNTEFFSEISAISSGLAHDLRCPSIQSGTAHTFSLRSPISREC